MKTRISLKKSLYEGDITQSNVDIFYDEAQIFFMMIYNCCGKWLRFDHSYERFSFVNFDERDSVSFTYVENS